MALLSQAAPMEEGKLLYAFTGDAASSQLAVAFSEVVHVKDKSSNECEFFLAALKAFFEGASPLRLPIFITIINQSPRNQKGGGSRRKRGRRATFPPTTYNSFLSPKRKKSMRSHCGDPRRISTPIIRCAG